MFLKLSLQRHARSMCFGSGAMRSFSTGSPSMKVFDRTLKRNQRNRAATHPESRDFDYLRDEAAIRLNERIEIIRKPLKRVLDLGSNTGNLLPHLMKRKEVEHIIMMDGAESMLTRDPLPSDTTWASVASSSSSSSSLSKQEQKEQTNQREEDKEQEAEEGEENALKPVFSAQTGETPAEENRSARSGSITISRVLADEEFIPLKENTLDAVVSSLSLHWVNNLPATFEQVRQVLKPDGVFVGCMLGGESLRELRSALAMADLERTGGITAHVSPFARLRDVGDLLTRAGFSMPTVDHDTITIRYPDMFTLMEHLQGMGEGNGNLSRPTYVSPDIFLAAAANYQECYTEQNSEDDLLELTFQIIYFTAWCPHPSQQQPLLRGSAKHSMKDIPNLPEMPPEIIFKKGTGDLTTGEVEYEEVRTPLTKGGDTAHDNNDHKDDDDER